MHELIHFCVLLEIVDSVFFQLYLFGQMLPNEIISCSIAVSSNALTRMIDLMCNEPLKTVQLYLKYPHFVQ